MPSSQHQYNDINLQNFLADEKPLIDKRFLRRRTCRMIEQTPNTCQLCDWTDSNTVTHNYHRWWGCNKRDNLRHVNTKGLKPLGQPHLRRVFLFGDMFTDEVYKICNSKRSKQDLCCRFGSDVLQRQLRVRHALSSQRFLWLGGLAPMSSKPFACCELEKGMKPLLKSWKENRDALSA